MQLLRYSCAHTSSELIFFQRVFLLSGAEHGLGFQPNVREPSPLSQKGADTQEQEMMPQSRAPVAGELAPSANLPHRHCSFPAIPPSVSHPHQGRCAESFLPAASGPREPTSASPGGCLPLSCRSLPHTRTSKYNFHHR